jgi:RnfABCDGE-type electron transport complex B subunit
MIAGIIIPVIAMALLGLAFGLGIAYALKVFGIEVDPMVALIISKLPGANCGVCGKAGCSGFAEALKKGEAIPSACVVSKNEARKAIAEILGIEYNPKVQTVAAVLCNGDRNNAKDKYNYKGIRHCKAAALVFGGYKECSFGCLGLGDCIHACPFDAIKIKDGIPQVDMKKCTACGNCIKTCPKNLFVLMPQEKEYYIKCSSKDIGAITIKGCKVGCIACSKCVKACPVNAINIKDNLAAIDYQICTNCGRCIEVCPTKAIARR